MTPEELLNALEGIHAYDAGAVDSGIRDERLRMRCIEHLAAMSDDELRIFLSKGVRDLYLSDEALDAGYGWEDARAFLNWIEDGCQP